jgi:YidC/Oxa1 family membrane protein insertase
VKIGLLNPLYTAVTWVLVKLHTVVGAVISPDSGLAWLLALAFLVILMRLVLLPLFIKQMHATRKMANLAPQLQELRKKYKGDKQTLNEQTMKLYRDNGVNPLGGCLPLVAQLPLFFALFGVLRAISTWHTGQGAVYGMPAPTVASFKNADIFGAHIWQKVLFTHGMVVPVHAKIVILCAVIISVVTTFLTVRQSTKRGMNPGMTPDNPMAASQKYMTYIVPFFALSGLYWQFGLVLYWMMTNIWTLGQQHILFKRYPGLTAAVAAAGGGTTSPPAKTLPGKTITGKTGTGRAAPGKKPAPPGGGAVPGAGGQ